jgi:molybdopterin-biosynthesis enzyme MoeA-like protein
MRWKHLSNQKFNPSFYSVIIGTELLNGRREDSHFSFLNQELVKRGYEHKANFVVKDDPEFLKEIFKLIKSDPNSVMFSFGGIGSTPDDFTREIASIAFTSEYPIRHKEAEKIIIDRLGERAYPHPIKMADIPRNSKLISNPINNMPGFQLDNRFFFVPGFPQMAHPMITNILDEFYPKNSEKYSCSFIAHTGEASMIDIMETLLDEVELSCLPTFDAEKRSAEIYLSSFDKELLKSQCEFFKDRLDEMGIEYG